MSKKELLKRLTILDFLSVDLQLYLNINPEDTDAIAKYNSVIKEADAIRAMLEKMDFPIYSFRSYSNDSKFSWVDNPWPWENEFNFDI